ncbi:MAG TPA: HNH endonuclease [Flavisolibacter sp.]|nr:HNH endonuclease [Flavisolibacter sp.]
MVTVLDTPDISFAPSDIVWIKNVLRNKGEGWAYDNISCKETFLLNWPTGKRGSAGTPKVGDIIVLFQKPNYINGKRNYKVHLTHLVTPVSPDIIPDEKYPKHKWCRRVQLIAMPNPIEAIPNPGHFSFFLPNRGLTNPIINLESKLNLSEVATQEEIWRLFEKHLCSNVRSKIFNPESPVGIFGEEEGDKIIKNHIKQEITRRNSKIVQIKKNQARTQGNGHILCECCDFDFNHTYGEHGDGFIECHHKIHVAAGKRITKLEDLALVCSNCHRMLHRKNTTNGYFTVEQLRKLILKRKAQLTL